jgi:hypothetical protein
MHPMMLSAVACCLFAVRHAAVLLHEGYGWAIYVASYVCSLVTG